MRHVALKSTKEFLHLAIVVTMLYTVSSCTSQDETSQISCGGTSTTFTEANGIIQSSCATSSSCHGSGSRNGPGELLTYSKIFSARSAIKTTVANGTMPQGSRLSSDAKNTIVCWIENGAANN